MGKDDDIGIEDIFVNYKNLQGHANADNTMTWEEVIVDTGLAAGGQRAWAINEAEVFLPLTVIGTHVAGRTSDDAGRLAVGVGRPGLADIGAAGEPPPPGVLCRFDWGFGLQYLSSGIGFIVLKNLPPWKPATALPYARNKISIYVGTDVDMPGLQDEPFGVRLSYTYIPVTDRLYREINERWALD